MFLFKCFYLDIFVKGKRVWTILFNTNMSFSLLLLWSKEINKWHKNTSGKLNENSIIITKHIYFNWVADKLPFNTLTNSNFLIARIWTHHHEYMRPWHNVRSWVPIYHFKRSLFGCRSKDKWYCTIILTMIINILILLVHRS